MGEAIGTLCIISGRKLKTFEAIHILIKGMYWDLEYTFGTLQLGLLVKQHI